MLLLSLLIMSNNIHGFISDGKDLAGSIYGKRKVYATITAAILLLASTFLALDSLSLQLPSVNMKAFAQSSELIIIGSTSGSNAPNTNIFNLTAGYTIKPIVWNLTAPDTVTFDNKGNMYIGEAGYYSYFTNPLTNVPQLPKILKVDPSGNVSVFVDTQLNSPIVDITFHDGLLYVSHRDKISTVDITNANATVKDIIVGLPNNGDHLNNQIAFSPDGKRLFFGTGTSTNSGVVGMDNYVAGWVSNTPSVADVPGKNITLIGQNFETPNPLTAEPNDNATTGAFAPFNSTTKEGQLIKGDVKCNGCILSANLDGTDLKLVGWGFRNPDGLAFNEEGRLFTAVNGADERGSRPIVDDADKFYELKLNSTSFYGWPDFFGNAQPVTDPLFRWETGGPCIVPKTCLDKPLGFLMQNHPPVEKPLALFEPPHTAVMQMAFANKSFGFGGEAFVAQVGAHIVRGVGQNLVRVNIDNETTISDFLNLKKPFEANSTTFRPTDIAFSQNGTALYIADWGNLLEPGPGGTIPNTGVIWKITPVAGNQISGAATSTTNTKGATVQ
jgi:glucose/arabinose dehydrogenase